VVAAARAAGPGEEALEIEIPITAAPIASTPAVIAKIFLLVRNAFSFDQ